MPTRLLREGILTSDRINKLGWGAEVFYRRLMSRVDDYGLFDARISVIRTSLYPLAIERATENNCKQWLSECESAGLLTLYYVDGKRYLQMLDTKWQIRSTPKYPAPTVNNCKQLLTPVYLDVDVDVDVDEADKTAPSKPSPTKKGSRLPADWELPDQCRAWALEQDTGFPVALEADKFRDYWTAKAGASACKLDWPATWRNWVRAHLDRKPGKPANKNWRDDPRFQGAL